MTYVSRAQQIANRRWDPYSPLRRLAVTQVRFLSLGTQSQLSDELLDGVRIEPRSAVAKWRNENDVHAAFVLSERVNSTRCFLGPQVLAARDDVRKLSHILVMEADRLVVVTLELMEQRARHVVFEGFTQRAHVTINKYDSTVHVVHASADGKGGTGLFWNDRLIPTVSSDIDFPFLTFAQVPIGHVQLAPPHYGILTYKCRKSGRLFRRIIDANGDVGVEEDLTAPQCVGGVDCAISGDNVLFRIDAVMANNLVTMTALSADRGQTIPAFTAVDLSGFDADQHLPTTSPVFQDYLGQFHVPVAVTKGDARHFFDVMDDAAVEAMTLSTRGFGHLLARFPKAGGKQSARGRGDGFTDGIGIIATALDKGRLLVSNSQSGGIHYPPERILNHEMQLMFAFKATECCYTRAQQPNTVSMDYLFIEADSGGNPVSQQLFLETWDMPLPEPHLTASVQGRTVSVTIQKDAWFHEGKTTFGIEDPRIRVESARLTGDRTAEVTFDSDELTGKVISFEMKNLFYWHAGQTIIR
jgi:hypothetical protein